MGNSLKTAVNKWSAGYLAIGCIGAALAFFIHVQSTKDYDTALQNYRKDSQAEAEQAAKMMSNSLAYIYQGIRTISLLPSVKNIDRHGKNLSADSHESINQIYHNMASNIAVSEVYIVPVDIDPEALDPSSGKKREPILMFDGKVTSKKTGIGAHLEEEEIYEYKLLKEQMDYLKKNYPFASSADHFNLPFISGSEVITCDNSEYATTMNDIDRSGLIFSVPFYGTNGTLKGTISAIIRSNVLKNLMPDRDHALLNQTYHYVVMSKHSGQEKVSQP